MASGTLPGASPPALSQPGPPRADEQVIERQLRKARRQVKLIELGSGLLVLVVGVLAYLGAAILIDHWVWELGGVTRWLALAGLVAAAGWYSGKVLLPILIRGINPNYAAWAIEQTTPSLKNSLLNFLLLRQQRDKVSEGVLRALEQQTAAAVEPLPIEATIDHGKLLRLGYVLAAILAVLAVYKVASPKDPLPTVARVLTPWSSIARPTRVQIRDVQPGDAEVYQGQHAIVSARIVGSRTDKPAEVIWSSADGQVVDRHVELKPGGAGVSGAGVNGAGPNGASGPNSSVPSDAPSARI
ncbi:MAG TPA: hypothetical protein PLV92_23955, partial [Pirellulaceae bacterium]|nr:hypothetical protein [Pirellulaceae bacterium]